MDLSDVQAMINALRAAPPQTPTPAPLTDLQKAQKEYFVHGGILPPKEVSNGSR